MTPPVRPEQPLSPVQKMMANLRAMREQGATPEEQAAEIDRWKPKIAAFNQREMADAGSAANLAVRGFTSNFSDELAGLASGAAALVPGGAAPGEAYRAGRDAIRMTNEAYAAEHPGKALAAEFGGALLGGVATGAGAARAVPGALGAAGRFVGLTPTATRLGRFGQAVGAGATAGALAGAGGAEGDVADRARGAGTGAVFGGVAGGTMAAAGQLASAGARRLGLGPRAATTPIGRVQGAVGATTADEAAAQRVARAVEASGRTVDDVLAPTAALDPSAVLADVDVGGQKAMRLAGTGRRLGNTAAERAEQTLGTRARGRGLKLQEDLATLTGAGRVNVADEADRLIAEARTASRPLYDQLKRFPARPDPRVNEAIALIPEDRVAALWKGVRDISRMDGRKLTKQLLDPKTGQLAFDLEPAEIDLFKKALDEVIYTGSRQAKMGQPGGLTNAETALLQRARQMLVEAADEMTGGLYAQARAAYAGPVAIWEALEQGGQLPRMGKDELARVLRDLTPAQRTAFERGGLEALQAELDAVRPGQINVARNLQSPKRLGQVRAALGPNAPAFERTLQGETAREATEQAVLRGSQTAERLADDDLVTLPLNPQRGLVGTAVDAARKPLERAVWLGSTAPEMDAVTRILTEPIGDPAVRAQVLRLLKAGQRAQAEQAARVALRNAGVAGQLGSQSP